MKIRNESGSAHAIVVIILVVALVGALGFIFWQNFMNKANTSDKAINSDTHKKSPVHSTTDQASKNGLIITDWKINIPANGELSYALQDTDHATIYSTELTTAEKNADCDETNGVSIYRTDSLDNVEPSLRGAAKMVGSYYYGFTHSSQALCVGQGSAKGTDQGDATVNSAYESLYGNISAAWNKLTAV